MRALGNAAFSGAFFYVRGSRESIFSSFFHIQTCVNMHTTVEVWMLKKSGMLKCFVIGAIGYPCLELVWRGRTHPSMALAGGTCLCALRHINDSLPHVLLPLRAGVGAAAITGIELLCGELFNRRHQVWDYRDKKHHFRGHICAEYSALWLLLCMALMPHMRRMHGENLEEA